MWCYGTSRSSGGGAFLSHSWSGSFYFYAPSCPEGAGCPSIPSSQPSMRQGVCLEWILGGWEHLSCCCCWVEIGGDAPRPLVLRCIVWMNEALMRNKHIDWSTLAVNISCSLRFLFDSHMLRMVWTTGGFGRPTCCTHLRSSGVFWGHTTVWSKQFLGRKCLIYIHSSLIYPRWWILEAMGEN